MHSLPSFSQQQFLTLFSLAGMNGHLVSETRDSISNSESGDHDSDTMDSEKALNLAMDDEAFENQSLTSSKSGVAVHKSGSFAGSIPNEGSYGSPPNAAVPTSGGSTHSSNSMANSAAAALAGGAGSLPLNQLAQVNTSHSDSTPVLTTRFCPADGCRGRCSGTTADASSSNTCTTVAAGIKSNIFVPCAAKY